MKPEQAKALRAPFPPEAVGKLPKPTKRENPKGKCNECGGYHGLPAVHLDYVGHAAVTDRLLQVDPEWTWEPMARGAQGEPLLTNGGLWINLTIAGVTRPGFGDEGNGKGMKEIIGDAIRNGAMRFGVALDLWSKEDLSSHEDDTPSVSDRKETPRQKQTPTATSGAPPLGSGGKGEPSSKEADGSPFTIPDGAVPKQRPVDGPDSTLTPDQKAQIEALMDQVAAASGATVDAVIAKSEKDYGPLALMSEGAANQLIARFMKFLATAEAAA